MLGLAFSEANRSRQIGLEQLRTHNNKGHQAAAVGVAAAVDQAPSSPQQVKHKRTRRRRRTKKKQPQPVGGIIEEDGSVTSSLASPTMSVSSIGGSSRGSSLASGSRHSGGSRSKGSGKHGDGTGSTKQHDMPMKKRDLYFCLRCGMVEVVTANNNATRGDAVGRVTVVNWDNQVVLDTLVHVTRRVTDFRTSATGITPARMKRRRGVDLDQVREMVSNLIRGKILVGHGLEVDLAALGVTHPWCDVRDTATYPPFMKQVKDPLTVMLLPRDLPDLLLAVLSRDVTEDCSDDDVMLEEAFGCLDLYKAARGAWEEELVKLMQQKERQREMVMSMRSSSSGSGSTGGNNSPKKKQQHQVIGLLSAIHESEQQTHPKSYNNNNNNLPPSSFSGSSSSTAVRPRHGGKQQQTHGSVCGNTIATEPCSTTTQGTLSVAAADDLTETESLFSVTSGAAACTGQRLSSAGAAAAAAGHFCPSQIENLNEVLGTTTSDNQSGFLPPCHNTQGQRHRHEQHNAAGNRSWSSGVGSGAAGGCNAASTIPIWSPLPGAGNKSAASDNSSSRPARQWDMSRRGGGPPPPQPPGACSLTEEQVIQQHLPLDLLADPSDNGDDDDAAGRHGTSNLMPDAGESWLKEVHASEVESTGMTAATTITPGELQQPRRPPPGFPAKHPAAPPGHGEWRSETLEDILERQHLHC